MTLIIDAFTAKKHLPVHVSRDGMELLDTKFNTGDASSELFIEIGDDIASTPNDVKTTLQAYFPNVLEQAIEEGCEYVQFYI